MRRNVRQSISNKRIQGKFLKINKKYCKNTAPLYIKKYFKRHEACLEAGGWTFEILS